MKTLKEINKEAEESYETYFKENIEKNDEAFRGKDVVLDTHALEDEMTKKKIAEENKIDSLHVLKEELKAEAMTSYTKVFDDKPKKQSAHRKNVDEVYCEFNKEKEEMLEKMAEYKKKK